MSNPHKRAIYDTLGPKALVTSGWELVERRFSPEEIREEYERLVRQREEQLLQEEAHPRVSFRAELEKKSARLTFFRDRWP